MAFLSSQLIEIAQRAGASAYIDTPTGRVRFYKTVESDLANLIYQWNNVAQPLFAPLHDEDEEALSLGLSGNVIYTDVEATEDSVEAFYSTDLERKRTVKETIDYLLGVVKELQDTVAALQTQINGS